MLHTAAATASDQSARQAAVALLEQVSIEPLRTLYPVHCLGESASGCISPGIGKQTKCGSNRRTYWQLRPRQRATYASAQRFESGAALPSWS